ncbi:DUF7147 family protein [Kurthia huakuii]|uniref:DUF7147 family protein n=1 Tax=Kurthia huakuii TaxID=1421019 RepID=UPI0004960CB8|nr:hypothetical protein [Kurthia huakuii]MBM7698425.1 hypothetical protein [Kurthia huakuii]
MIERFIELGQGYGDLYEILELMRTNQHRIHNTFVFVSEKDGKQVASFAVAMKPIGDSKFMPIYICREGMPYHAEKTSQRYDLFKESIEAANKTLITLEVKHSSAYVETTLYYQYLIGLLRLYHYIPNLG